MSGSTSRGLNVSEFIANLNSLEDPLDSIGGNGSGSGNDNHEDELSIYSNTHFFDFDMGCSTDIAATVDDLLMQQEKQLQSSKPVLPSPDLPHHSLDFTDLQQFSIVNELLPEHSESHHNTPAGGPSGVNRQHAHGQQPSSFAFPAQLNHASPSSSGSRSSNSTKTSVSDLTSSHGSTPNSQFSLSHHIVGAANQFTSVTQHQDTFDADDAKKRRISIAPTVESTPRSMSSDPTELDVYTPGTPRVAAEEDKRRRNTAASARFRIKKKLREQQMERTAKDLQEKVQSLETKIMQLEMENKWLKNLVVEKNEARDRSDLLDMKNKVLSSNNLSDNTSSVKNEDNRGLF